MRGRQDSNRKTRKNANERELDRTPSVRHGNYAHRDSSLFPHTMQAANTARLRNSGISNPRAEDTTIRRRHVSHAFGPGPRSSPEAAQRGVEDAGLEVGPGPEDNGACRPFAASPCFMERHLRSAPTPRLRPPIRVQQMAPRPGSSHTPPAPSKSARSAGAADCTPSR
jgi:hypothetical protein